MFTIVLLGFANLFYYLCDWFCRYKLNDSDLLNRCTFLDPRVKSLTHLTDTERNDVYSKVLTMIETETESDSDPGPGVTAANEPPVVPTLLFSLLHSFSQAESAEAGGLSCAATELQRYKALPTCPMNSNPLSW